MTLGQGLTHKKTNLIIKKYKGYYIKPKASPESKGPSNLLPAH